MSDERLDQTIDEVALALTRGEPGGAFRAQVLARIETGETPRAGWRAMWLIAPLAAAALIAFALLIARPAPSHSIDVARDIPAPAVERPAPEHSAEASRDVEPSPPDRSPRGSRDVDARAQDLAPLDGSPLDRVASIRVDTLAPDSISLEQLDAVAPITVVPLDIADPQRRFE